MQLLLEGHWCTASRDNMHHFPMKTSRECAIMCLWKQQGKNSLWGNPLSVDIEENVEQNPSMRKWACYLRCTTTSEISLLFYKQIVGECYGQVHGHFMAIHCMAISCMAIAWREQWTPLFTQATFVALFWKVRACPYANQCCFSWYLLDLQVKKNVSRMHPLLLRIVGLLCGHCSRRNLCVAPNNTQIVNDAV